ncbi:MAG: hypothetical protein U0736_09665 [Gemmataceae bacterium]
MPGTLDLEALRLFTDELTERARRCDNGEGLLCASLEASIEHYVQLCRELRACVNRWAHAVFTGEAECDPGAEALLRRTLQAMLRRAKEVAARGRAMDGQCFVLLGLNDLHFLIADIDYLLENWVTPRRAVSPAPRTKLTRETERQVADRLTQLATLPTAANRAPNDTADTGHR